MRRLSSLVAAFAAMAFACGAAIGEPQVNSSPTPSSGTPASSPFRVAVGEFTASGSDAAPAMAAQIAAVMRADLASSILFRGVDPASYTEHDLNVGRAPHFDQWTAIQAQILVVGNVVLGKDGGLLTQFRVFDAEKQRELLGQQYQVMTTDNWRRVAHKMADDVYSVLTHEPRYFDSRITFVTEERFADGAIRRRLTIMDSDGDNLERLSPSFDAIANPRQSSSYLGSSILFSAVGPGRLDPKAISKNAQATIGPNVYLYDIETSRQEVLLPGQGARGPATFASNHRSVLLTLETNGTSRIALLDTPAGKVSYPGDPAELHASHPEPSPDGLLLAYVSSGETIRIARLDGGAQDCPSGRSETACIIASGGGFTSLAWSPQGNEIAFTREIDGHPQLGFVRPSGQGMRMLPGAGEARDPSWAPNGRTLVFTRSIAAGQSQLWAIDSDGRNLRRLPAPEGASQPNWSPVGY